MDFLESTRQQFRNYKLLAEKAMAQLGDRELLAGGDDVNNSIVIIVQHLHGNMLSRWTNFLTEDGEKPWRKRDDEFEESISSREELFRLWEEGWTCVLENLARLTESDLDKTIRIRGEAMSAVDAVLRQLTHYSYHIGQIVMLCKRAAGAEWASLTIPRKAREAHHS
jgi:hypothetical protein